MGVDRRELVGVGIAAFALGAASWLIAYWLVQSSAPEIQPERRPIQPRWGQSERDRSARAAAVGRSNVQERQPKDHSKEIDPNSLGNGWRALGWLNDPLRLAT